MLRNYKRSFLDLNIDYIVEIEKEDMDLILKKKIINNTIKKINKEQGFIRGIVNYLYYCFSYYISFLCILCYKKHTIKKMYFLNDKEENRLYNKKHIICIYDKGIYIHKITIPYENIIAITIQKEYCYIDIFATVIQHENGIKIELSDTITKFILVMENKHSKILNDIKVNMYYHMKYNKINFQVVENYYKNNLFLLDELESDKEKEN
jgi:hypothetical protein